MFTPILEGQRYGHAVGKVVCIGRNYAAHAAELNNPVPDQPVLFLKPSDAVCDVRSPVRIPEGLGEVHHELEVAVLIGETLTRASADEVSAAIAGVGLGLDLTLRDIQTGLKEKRLPWDRAKAFDHACPISEFVSVERVSDWQNLSFSIVRNGELQQTGNTRDMLNTVIPLIAHMSETFRLNPGDVIMTGTPPGVGPLVAGDKLELSLEDWISLQTTVVNG